MSIAERKNVNNTHIPKIAVPIISRSREDILSDAERIAGTCADIVEWRADFYDAFSDAEKTADLAMEIGKTVAGKAQLLFTCRTSAEGGEAAISAEDYRKLLLRVIECRGVDMIDAEYSAAGEFLEELIEAAQDSGITVVLSYHNFKETPDRATILKKYEDMFKVGGHILKIAVMPNCREDVDKMISVTREAAEKITKPLIAIVMGEMGKCTRIAAEAIGSCVTFGSIGGASAPGQIDAERLSRMLAKVHENIDEFCKAEDSAKLTELTDKYCIG